MASRGRFLIFLDSDDLLDERCLTERFNRFGQNPEMDFLVFPVICFSESPEEPETHWNIDSPENDLHRFLRLDAVWQTAGSIWKRETVINIGGFDESLACWQDVDIHIRALTSGMKYMKFLDLPADAYYRRHSAHSISQQNIRSPEKIRSRIYLLNKLQKIKQIQYPFLKHLFANVILAASVYPNPFLSYELIIKAFASRQLSLKECIGLAGILLAQHSRLVKFDSIGQWSKKLTGRYLPTTTVCSIPV